ncbi:MAG: hypothetical protein IPP79_08095 [Chitinophagaceae bacterium]|nr:hypothetical protein [Chitinophagaceae bacterium]
MSFIEILGFVGAFLSSVTFIPQVIHAWKTKSVGDLSLWMIIILLGNVSTWLTYGIYLHLRPVIVANSIILALALLMLYFKLTFKKA